MQTLTHFDSRHQFIENPLWKTQVEERQEGVKVGATFSNLHTIEGALEIIKSDYLHLLSDKDHAIKFVEKTFSAFAEKEKEVDEVNLDLSLAHYSLYRAENWSLVAGTSNEQECDTRTMKVKQMI